MGALTGVRVLDFTWYAAGPIGTKYLADNGAEVVKIESMARLDNIRNAAPWKDGVPGFNRSQFFGSFNSSKKSVTLNMATERGRELALELVPHFDVVTDSLSAGLIQHWGLGYEQLCAVKPDIIQLSSCMQGQWGPRSKNPGFGTALAPLSGFDSITGYDEGDLAPPFGAYTDFVIPRFIAFALLGALDHHRRTGEGQYIDMSQFEAALHYLAPPFVDYFATGTVMGPHANRSERYSPHGSYRCQDVADDERWIAIAVENDAEWEALLRVLGHEGDPAFDSQPLRIRESLSVDDFVGRLVRDLDAPTLAAELQAAGVAAYPVQSCLDLRADDNLEAFGFWPWLDQEECGPMPYDGFAYRLCRTPGEQTAAPNVGAHTEEVLGRLLGIRDDELKELISEGIVY